MSGERLREELARIAEGAPQVDVPADLYARGRRATARARVLAAGAAVACVALLVAVLAPALQTDRTPVAGKPAPAMPDHIHAVPLHVDDAQTDLKIGIGAAAFVTETGIPVVVSAMTGEYHLLDLEGLLTQENDSSGPTLDHPPIALSPDGQSVAWGWLERGGDDLAGARSGIRIADLETGVVRDVVIEAERPVLVNQVSWSSDSRWVGWGGTFITKWTDDAFNTETYLGGHLRPGENTTDWVELPEPTSETDQQTIAGDLSFLVAVTNTGELSAISGNLWWQPGNRTQISLRADLRISTLWSEAGRWFVLVHSVDGDEVAMVRELPDGQDQLAFTLAPQPRMLGVLSDGTLLLHQESLDGDGRMPPNVEIVTPDAQAGEIDALEIIDVDPGVLGLTLAADLIDPDHPTVERPAPDWPWSTERKLVVGGLALLGLVLLGGVVLLARRLSTR
ncbi:hypothetical protein [Nocardioides sp. WS12]|uniref:hypothetical protein n=1 Tax=Nocardioides sp. WS12 TaxID=2486272 RepID=UPI0015FB8B0A|nr:hypothetical protein [Nocardioides sp. WS12]